MECESFSAESLAKLFKNLISVENHNILVAEEKVSWMGYKADSCRLKSPQNS